MTATQTFLPYGDFDTLREFKKNKEEKYYNFYLCYVFLKTAQDEYSKGLVQDLEIELEEFEGLPQHFEENITSRLYICYKRLKELYQDGEFDDIPSNEEYIRLLLNRTDKNISREQEIIMLANAKKGAKHE